MNFYLTFLKCFLKTLYFNFKFLNFKTALHLPIMVSNKVKISKCKGKIYIKNPSFCKIKLGFDATKSDIPSKKSVVYLDGELYFDSVAFIGSGFRVHVEKNAVLNIGNNFTNTGNLSIHTYYNIYIGNDVLCSWDVKIMDSDMHSIYSLNDNVLLNPNKKVIVGEKVWICNNVLILKGASIGNNCVIGACSLVTGDCIDSNSIYIGCPAKKVKSNIEWKQDRP